MDATATGTAVHGRDSDWGTAAEGDVPAVVEDDQRPLFCGCGRAHSEEKRRSSAADQRSFGACMGPYGQPSLIRCQYGIMDRKTPQLPGARTC
jgi:hypothetical protein